MSWPAVPLRSTLGDWAGRTIAAGGLGDLGRRTTALLTISKVRRDGQVGVTYTDLAHEKLDPPRYVLLPADLTVSEAVLGFSHVRPVRAGVPPRVTGLKGQTRTGTALAMGIAAATIVALGAIVQSGPLIYVGVIMGMGAIFTFFGRTLIEAGLKTRVWDGYSEILASDVYGRLEFDDSSWPSWPGTRRRPTRPAAPPRWRRRSTRPAATRRDSGSTIFRRRPATPAVGRHARPIPRSTPALKVSGRPRDSGQPDPAIAGAVLPA